MTNAYEVNSKLKDKITGDFFKKDFEKKIQEALDKKNKRNNRVMLALNDEEYNKLLDLAGRQRLAVFIRNKIIDLES